MNVNSINTALLAGEIDKPGILPHLDTLNEAAYKFKVDFGLEKLPVDPGLVIIRGARQYGKSTWLEENIADTIQAFGPGSALYLNGDMVPDWNALIETIRETVNLFPNSAPIRRLFIDEITAVQDWQKALKILADGNELRKVLLVTTGSKASDLMRGQERLPGRKGALKRTQYLFTPIRYGEFREKCGGLLGERTLEAYCLAGGCPAACSEIARHGLLPAWITEMIRDWIFGEFAAAGRSRIHLLHVMDCLIRRGGTPVGQNKLAKEAGLANNTVAADYVRLLTELLCVAHGYAWDASALSNIPRKPEKTHFINTLAVSAFHQALSGNLSEIASFPDDLKGVWHEWIVAQELWRKAAVSGRECPENLPFWQSKEHEIDFVNDGRTLIEVKAGAASPMDFVWFPKTFPKSELVVINRNRFDAGPIRGVTLEDFLLS